MKENDYTKKTRSRRYLAETITDADDADDIALFANTPTQAESQLHSLEQATGGIGLHGVCVLIKKRHISEKWWFS